MQCIQVKYIISIIFVSIASSIIGILHFIDPDKDVLFMPKGKRNFVSLDLSTGKEDEVYSLGNNIESKMSCWVYVPCYLV